MMRNQVLLPPKDDEKIPDHYGFTITYIDKSKESYEGIHVPVKELGLIDIVTKDDQYLSIPIINIKKIEFDKNFSTYMARLKVREDEEEQAILQK